jgi:LCP family protein required for cell wall assembly
MGNALKRFWPHFKYWGLILGSALVGGWVVLIFLGWLIGQLGVTDFILNVTPKRLLNGVNILALGLDETPGVQRSDTLMVIHIDPKKNRIGVLAIPRDTRVVIPGVGASKINHAYAKGKAPLAQDVVSSLLGVPIHHTVVIRLSAIASLVDRLGGLPMHIEKPMHYVDRAGKLYIHLPAGDFILNGDQVLQYLRFRHDAAGDIGRVSRHQQFLQAALSRLKESGQWLKLPLWCVELTQAIQTDLSMRELLGLAFQVQSILNQGNIRTETLPGKPLWVKSSSYWEIDPQRSVEAIQRIFHGGSVLPPSTPFVGGEELTADDSDTELYQAPLKKRFPSVGGHPFKVDILDGSGRSGRAQHAIRSLQCEGLHLISGGNTSSYPETVIIDWKGHMEAVLELAHRVGVRPDHILVFDRPDKSVDATVVIGQDWDVLKPGKI